MIQWRLTPGEGKFPLPPFFKGDYALLDIREFVCYLGNHQGLKEISDENQDHQTDDTR